MGRYTKVIVNGRVHPAHVVLWEKMNGPIPKGCEIHHKNGDGRDNRLENLACLTKSDHLKLHNRLRREGVDPVDATDPDVIASRNSCKLYRQRHKSQVAKKHKEYIRLHKEEIALSKKLHHERNRDLDLSKMKTYYEEHRDHILSKRRAYADKNSEKIASYQKSYRDTHKDEKYAYTVKYRKEHKLELNAKLRLRRAIKANKPKCVIDSIMCEIDAIKKGR